MNHIIFVVFILIMSCKLFYDIGFDNGILEGFGKGFQAAKDDGQPYNHIDGYELYSRIIRKICDDEDVDIKLYHGAEITRKEILKMMEEKKK